MTHRFLVLGPIQVLDPHGRQVRISEHKVRALLAMLLANANTPVSTGALIDALWGDRPPHSAAANLQTYVWKLRHWLGRGELERDSGGYRLLVAPDDVDATRCAGLAQLGRRQLDDGATGAALATLCDAAALCRGEPFQGAHEVTNQPSVLRLREQCRTLRENLVEARLALGQHATAVPDLVVLTTEQPYRERQWAQLMLALHRCGRRAEALAAYQRVRRVLSTELGIEPGSQLRELQSAILREGAVDDRPPAAQPAREAHGLHDHHSDIATHASGQSRHHQTLPPGSAPSVDGVAQNVRHAGIHDEQCVTGLRSRKGAIGE